MKQDFDRIIAAVEAAKIGQLNPATIAYWTPGGHYVIATDGKWTDSGAPRDLAVILPLPIEGTRVIPLYVGVNPDLITALRAALDTED